MNIRVLGHFGLITPGQRPVVPPRLVARIGTILAGWPGEWVDRDRLLCDLWGERPPRTALNTLQAHISQLRRVVGKDSVLGDANGYMLDVDPATVDAEAFTELTQEAARAQRQMHLGRARDLLTRALDLWHGAPYADAEDADLLARRTRLEEMLRIAQEDLLECRLLLSHDSYQLNDVIACAKELVSLEPLRERRHVLLINALESAQRQAEATAALDAAINHIRSLTGIDPSQRIRESISDTEVLSTTRLTHAASTGRSTHGDDNGVDQSLLDSVVETLVVHDVPTLLACLPETHQQAFAEAAAAKMADDFPLGTHIIAADDQVASPETFTRGVLRILVNVDEQTVLECVQHRNRADGAMLLLSSAPPQERTLIPVVTATSVEEIELLRASS